MAKSKLPDVQEITKYAGKLFKDIKHSISGICQEYSEARDSKEEGSTEKAEAKTEAKPEAKKPSEKPKTAPAKEAPAAKNADAPSADE